MDKRTLLAVVLSIAVLGAYQFYSYQKIVDKPVEKTAPMAVEAKKETVKQSAAAIPQALSAIPKTAARKQIAAKDIQVETNQYIAVFSTKGGALKSFQLKGYQKECVSCSEDIYPYLKGVFTGKKYTAPPKSRDLVELVDVREGMPYPLTVSFPQSSADIAADSVFESNKSKLDLLNEKEKQELIFSQTYDKIKVEKIYTFNPDNYTVTLDVKVTNLMAEPITQVPQLSWLNYVDMKQNFDSYGHDGPVASVTGSATQYDLKEMGAEKIIGPNVLWSGYESKYFIASMIPQNPSLTNLILSKNSSDMVEVSLKGQKELIPGGQSSTFNYSLYLGPKEYKLLKAQNVGLEDSIDFGSWLKWLAIPLLYTLNFLNDYVHNYGLAIIILTLLITIIFWPLKNMSYKSMKEMQKIQPLVLALKEKYKKDQAKLSQETMALYKTHKVNPMGGCLPILIQIPVFFGLYKTLLYCIELRHSPFFWWIQDLSANDPYYITPIIMGATQFITQKMTPTMGDPLQAKLMLLMPVIFTFFFLTFPSGLVVYWLFSNLLGIAQQLYINKKITR